ncbi:MAG: MFS transporter [Oligoflexales bacterium]
MTQLIFFAMGMFTMGCSSYIIAGLLPKISSTLGATTAATGQGVAAFGLTYVVCAPVFAVLLAKKPARRILLLALAVFAMGNVVTMLSSRLTIFLLGRAIAGLGAGLYSPICVAAAVHMVGPEARGKSLSFIWGANSAGAVIGVPIGLWLSNQFGWQYAIGLILLFSVFSLIGVSAQKIDIQVKAPPSLAARLKMLVDRRVVLVIAVTCLTATGSLGLYTYLGPMQTDAANSLTATLFVWSLGGLVGSTFVGYFVDRTHKPSWVMATILTILIAAILTLPLVHSIPFLGLAPFLVWGAMGWATVTPQQHTLISLQPEQSATLAALNGSAISLGSVLGSAFGGSAIASGLDVKNLPYAAASLLLCALALQILLIKKSYRGVSP